MRTSDTGLNLIAEFEGYVGELYNDPTGNCTIGIGHLVHHGTCNGNVSEAPFLRGITYSDAVHLLQDDVRRYEDAVNRLITVQLNQNMFDALVSFTFNVGIGALTGSTLRNVLNMGLYEQVPTELARWNKGTIDGVRVVLPGLTRRRAAEAELWSTPVVPIEGRNDLLTREYNELKREIANERARTDFLAVIAVGFKGAIDFLSAVVRELVKRTGGPGVQ